MTHLEKVSLDRMLKSIATHVERECIAHFGLGKLVITPRGKRDQGMAWRVAFEPQILRDRIMVKMECERLKEDAKILTEPRVLGMQAAVSYLISRGEFRIPRPNAVLVVETLEEILSDKIRALLERPYLKGRDIYDVWHLRERLGTPLVQAVVERKFSCYEASFTERRTPAWFETADQDLIAAIENDLGRFLSPSVMAACRNEEYRPFLHSIKALFKELTTMNWKMPA